MSKSSVKSSRKSPDHEMYTNDTDDYIAIHKPRNKKLSKSNKNTQDEKISFFDQDNHDVESLINDQDLENIGKRLTKKTNYRTKHSYSGDMQTTEYFLFNHVIKYKLLSKEEEIYIVNKKSKAFKKILATLIITPDILQLVQKLRTDIIEQNYSLSTIIDINHLQRLMPNVKENDLSELILSRIDDFITLFQKFSQSIKKLKQNTSSAALQKILDLAEEYKIVDNLIYLSFKRKYLDNIVDKFKKHRKRLQEIEASFEKSRTNKKKKDAILQKEHSEIVLSVGCSTKLLYKILDLMHACYKEYNKYRNILINANQRLVYSLARSYAGGNQQLLLDLIQEGFYGLYNGIDKFDALRGCRLATLLFCWIKHCIQRFCTKMAIVRTPVHANETAGQIYRAENVLSDLHGYSPSMEQIAEYTGFTVNKIWRIKNATKKIIRFDKKISSEGSMNASDYIMNDQATSSFKTADVLLQDNSISTALKPLVAKEEELMRRRIQQEKCGHLPSNSLSTNVHKFVARLSDSERKNLIKKPTITSVFNAPQGRVRQIYTRMIYKLRNSSVTAAQGGSAGQSNNNATYNVNINPYKLKNYKKFRNQGPRAYNNQLYNWMRKKFTPKSKPVQQIDKQM